MTLMLNDEVSSSANSNRDSLGRFVKDQYKLVEFFGDYWHDISEEIQRISHFKGFGWDCLVIWDSELKNDFAMVADKLNEFVGQLN